MSQAPTVSLNAARSAGVMSAIWSSSIAFARSNVSFPLIYSKPFVRNSNKQGSSFRYKGRNFETRDGISRRETEF